MRLNLIFLAVAATLQIVINCEMLKRLHLANDLLLIVEAMFFYLLLLIKICITLSISLLDNLVGVHA